MKMKMIEVWLKRQFFRQGMCDGKIHFRFKQSPAQFKCTIELQKGIPFPPFYNIISFKVDPFLLLLSFYSCFIYLKDLQNKNYILIYLCCWRIMFLYFKLKNVEKHLAMVRYEDEPKLRQLSPKNKQERMTRQKKNKQKVAEIVGWYKKREKNRSFLLDRNSIILRIIFFFFFNTLFRYILEHTFYFLFHFPSKFFNTWFMLWKNCYK